MKKVFLSVLLAASLFVQSGSILNLSNSAHQSSINTTVSAVFIPNIDPIEA